MSCVIYYSAVHLSFHNILYSSEKDYELIDSEHNRWMNCFIVKNPADLVVALSEVYVRILTNVFYSISNDILQMTGEYKERDIVEQYSLFLDYSVNFTRAFYFGNVCMLLKSISFLRMYKDFAVNYDYLGENLKIINDFYLQYCKKKFE